MSEIVAVRLNMAEFLIEAHGVTPKGGWCCARGCVEIICWHSSGIRDFSCWRRKLLVGATSEACAFSPPY